MVFWLFMLICTMILPICCIYYGNIFIKNPPEMNVSKGYRTSKSMRSKDAWFFAHDLLGRIWRVLGVALLVLSIAGMLYIRTAGITSVASMTIVIVGLQIVALFCSAVPVEMGLNKRFK